MTQLHQLMVCDNDKFACIGGHLFFYPCEQLPDKAIKVDTDDFSNTIYAIARDDINVSVLPAQIEFLPFRQLIASLSLPQANQLSKAMQLLRWQRDHQFCSRCGTPTQLHPMENATVCPSCQYHQYPRVQPCIITAVVNTTTAKPQILLAHHQRAKDTQMYTVLAGFVEVGESLEQCVHREVLEEVGLTVTNLHYFGSQPWPFPSNLMVGFIAEYQSGDIKIDKGELIDAQFFEIDSLGKKDSPITPPNGTIAYQLIEWVKSNYQD